MDKTDNEVETGLLFGKKNVYNAAVGVENHEESHLRMRGPITIYFFVKVSAANIAICC